MPLRSLTPLGRQLRSVLATIRTPCTHVSPSYLLRPSTTDVNCTQIRHGIASRRDLSAEAAATAYNLPTSDEHQQAIEQSPRALSARRLKRRTRVNRITEALRNSGHNEVLPVIPKDRPDHSHYNVRQRGGRTKYSRNALRHENDFVPTLAQTREVTLERILASYITHQNNLGELRWDLENTSCRFTRADASLLRAKGFDLGDVAAWASIITTPGSLSACQTLADRISSRGASSVPLFVLLYLLRRPFICAPALQIITNQACQLLSHRMSNVRWLKMAPNTVFLLFVRLIRHARQVWPAAMESITALLLEFLPTAISTKTKLTSTQLETLTFMLNKAMRLIALRTGPAPFRHNRFQEFALISILKFMAEHSPPIQTNREGYRAVVLVQLTQSKTKKERQWAELKGLSWPPWKQERTAMDFDITAEDHGVSKARETLLRMQEAGYSHRAWEKVASIYAGWDTDGTPTIQTRVVFGASVRSLRLGTAAWAARINTTRTAQEAWACYLAYADTNLPADQDVYLAIFQKLSKEEERTKQSKAAAEKHKSDDRLQGYPGDRKEVEPLPPSAHLYTYTRTPPPTMDDLYRTLHDRGVIFSGHCLAFLVSNAGSLQSGFEYLGNSISVYPQLFDMLDRHPPLSRSTSLPMPVFTAIVELLTRFPGALPHLTPHPTQRPGRAPSILVLDNHRLNSNHALVRAMELVYQRRPIYRPVWNRLLSALAQEAPLRGLYSMHIAPRSTDSLSQAGEEEKTRSAILAYRLARRLLAVMRHSHLDLDTAGFRAICQTTENAAYACWKHVKTVVESGSSDTALVSDAVNLLRNSGHAKRLKTTFRELVGWNSAVRVVSGIEDTETRDAWGVPSALERLNSAILHSYVRALGWTADHPGILEVVRWMVENQAELNENIKIDMNGEIMTRRLLLAIRAFLERSWLAPDSLELGYGGRGDESSKEGVLVAIRQRADPDLVEEARTLLDSVEEWGGWPEDEEVEEYCKHQRFEDTR